MDPIWILAVNIRTMFRVHRKSCSGISPQSTFLYPSCWLSHPPSGPICIKETQLQVELTVVLCSAALSQCLHPSHYPQSDPKTSPHLSTGIRALTVGARVCPMQHKTQTIVSITCYTMYGNLLWRQHLPHQRSLRVALLSMLYEGDGPASTMESPVDRYENDWNKWVSSGPFSLLPRYKVSTLLPRTILFGAEIPFPFGGRLLCVFLYLHAAQPGQTRKCIFTFISLPTACPMRSKRESQHRRQRSWPVCAFVIRTATSAMQSCCKPIW